MSKDTLIEMAKDAPLVSLAGLTLFGVDLQFWVVILAVAYGAWRLVTAVIEFYWKWKDRRDGRYRQETR